MVVLGECVGAGRCQVLQRFQGVTDFCPIGGTGILDCLRDKEDAGGSDKYEVTWVAVRITKLRLFFGGHKPFSQLLSLCLCFFRDL